MPIWSDTTTLSTFTVSPWQRLEWTTAYSTSTATVFTGNWPDGWTSVGWTSVGYATARPAPTTAVREAVVPARSRAQQQQELERGAAARERARETLRSLLSPAEQAHYHRAKEFFVDGSAGGRYLVREGHIQNVFQLSEDPSEPRVRLCAHPAMYSADGSLPVEDAMIAQLLMLRFDEPAFLALANWS